MTDAHSLHPTVLREYDIRGVVGDTLTPDDALAVGRAFGSIVSRGGGRTVCVGWDGRLSSPGLADALVQGLTSTGMEVIRVGLGPTPMLYFATKTLDTDAGVMITGSHNPPEYNGIKMLTRSGPFFGPDIQTLGRIAATGDFVVADGSSRSADLIDAYVEKMAADYRGPRDLKVVWDAGNGASGEVLRRLLPKLPGTHTLLFDEIDGTFPNHHPDPTVEANLAQLRAEAARVGADFGVGFDGDADRIGAIDGLGRVVWGDQLLAIYAEDMLTKFPGATIIADVKCSSALFEHIAKCGGRPLMWKTGHSLLKAKMIEIGSPLVGEMAGHIVFNDGWGFDDGLYCAVRLLDLVSRSGTTLAALRDRLPLMVNTPETRFQIDESRKFAIVTETRDRLRAAGAEINDIDGVRVDTPDGWWLLRASNTQDVLIARCEASDEAGLERLKAEVLEQLRLSGAPAPSFSGGH